MGFIRGSIFNANIRGKWINFGCNSTDARFLSAHRNEENETLPLFFSKGPGNMHPILFVRLNCQYFRNYSTTKWDTLTPALSLREWGYGGIGRMTG